MAVSVNRPALTLEQTLMGMSVLAASTLAVVTDHMSSDAYVALLSTILGAVLGVSVGAHNVLSNGNDTGK